MQHEIDLDDGDWLNFADCGRAFEEMVECFLSFQQAVG